MSKIKQFSSVVFLFFIFSYSYAQDKTIESLKTALSNPKINDTTRINMIINAMDKNIMLSKTHIEILNLLPPIYTKGLKKPNINPKVKNSYQYAAGIYYYNIAKKETNEGNNMSPIHYDEAIKYWKITKSNTELGLAIVGKGTYYRHVADWPNTFKYFFDALKFYENIKNESGLSTVYMEIGTACLAQKDWEKAIPYLKKALPYYENSEDQINKSDRYSLAVIYNNIGTAYTRLKKFPEARENFLKAYNYIKQNNDNKAESIVLVQLAQSSNDMGNLIESDDYLKRALALCNDDTSKQGVYGNAANINYRNKNYEKAAEYGELSYNLAKKNKDINPQLGITSLLYKIYKETRQFEKALKVYEASIILKDSINLEGSKNELAQRQLKYDFEKKELQQKIIQQKKLAAVKLEQQKKLASINLQQQKKVAEVKLQSEKKTAEEIAKNKFARQKLVYDFEKKQLNQKILQSKKLAAIKLESEKNTAYKNNLLIGLSGILLLFILGGIFYYRNNQQKQAIMVLEKNQIKQKLLISQMNPHFIFNSIQNIRGLINNNHNKEAVNYLEKFSTLTRQILENSAENYISLKEELQMISNYLNIQQLLYDNKFSFTIETQKTINTESIFIPPMLAQPFIENSIKHGLCNTTKNGKINVAFYLKEEKLYFEVTDNGKGVDSSKKTNNHKSLAMAITKERLANYTKNKGFEVQITNLLKADGTIEGAKVVLEIPYIYES